MNAFKILTCHWPAGESYLYILYPLLCLNNCRGDAINSNLPIYVISDCSVRFMTYCDALSGTVLSFLLVSGNESFSCQNYPQQFGIQGYVRPGCQTGSDFIKSIFI